ncbi:unnamed protein product [Cyclocybe aegerita]|uniref:Uncharacterized protein n=1 Tax=Cyclocybe aegerita TaxID=1973307 RepID=A0A8S0W576_CYCAE|nr:unnamed protein product [Cyclocybe aegerita]
MAGVFERIFGCCLSRKRSQILNVQPDERTHLIPALNEPVGSSLPSVYVVDHERMKERLSTIVRSKEGKMVNVAARLPFNLHNRNLSVTLLDPSYSNTASRSPSTSTSHSNLASAANPTSNSNPTFASASVSAHRPFPLKFTPISPSHVHGQVGAPLSSVVFPSESRESSLASREREFLRERTGEKEITGQRERVSSEASSGRRSLFGLTLVRGPLDPAKRGRRKQKGVEGSVDGTEGGGAGPGNENCHGARDHTHQETTTALTESTPAPGFALAVDPPAPEPGLSGVDIVKKPHFVSALRSTSRASSVSFKIHDTGPLTASWGS